MKILFFLLMMFIVEDVKIALQAMKFYQVAVVVIVSEPVFVVSFTKINNKYKSENTRMQSTRTVKTARVLTITFNLCDRILNTLNLSSNQ